MQLQIWLGSAEQSTGEPEGSVPGVDSLCGCGPSAGPAGAQYDDPTCVTACPWISQVGLCCCVTAQLVRSSLFLSVPLTLLDFYAPQELVDDLRARQPELFKGLKISKKKRAAKKPGAKKKKKAAAAVGAAAVDGSSGNGSSNGSGSGSGGGHHAAAAANGSSTPVVAAASSRETVAV